MSVGESIFVNRLVGKLLVNAPEVDSTVIVAVGATGLRQAFVEAELPGIVLSYILALKSVVCLYYCVGRNSDHHWCLFIMEKYQR